MPSHRATAKPEMVYHYKCLTIGNLCPSVIPPFHAASSAQEPESPRCSRREVDLPPFGDWSDMEDEPVEVPGMQSKEIMGISRVDVGIATSP